MPEPPFAKQAMQWLLNKLGELLIWGVLVVLFALLPIFLVYNNKRFGGTLTVPVKDLLVKGELLLVSAALAADSLARLASRLFAKRKQAGAFGLQHLTLFLASIAFIVIASSEYAQVAGRAELTGPGADYVFNQSEIFFALTLLTGASAILVD